MTKKKLYRGVLTLLAAGAVCTAAGYRCIEAEAGTG